MLGASAETLMRGGNSELAPPVLRLCWPSACQDPAAPGGGNDPGQGCSRAGGPRPPRVSGDPGVVYQGVAGAYSE